MTGSLRLEHKNGDALFSAVPTLLRRWNPRK